MSATPALLPAQDHPVAYYSPAWSPDSRTIAFESNRGGSFSIYTINRDGSDLRRLTPEGRDAVQPSWSPDGQALVFAWETDAGGQLWIMDRDGGHPRQVTSAPGKHFYPSFSPDGRWVVFGVQDPERRERYAIGVVAAGGGGGGGGYRILADSSSSRTGPRWTPDGRITFTQTPLLPRQEGEAMRDLARRRQAASRMVTVSADLTDERVLNTPVPPEDDAAVRSPDGRFTIEPESVAGVPGLTLVEVATGRRRVLVAGAE